MTVGMVPFLRWTNRCPTGVVQIGMFCPLDLFCLKELTHAATINNLTVVSEVPPRRGGREAGKRDGGERGFVNLCDLVI